MAQAFDPRYHRTSVVGALSEPAAPGGAASGFTPEEIGAIYAANWERDLSQAHPSLANVILAWKSVKLAAANPSRTDASIAAAEEGFNSACGAVVAQVNSVGVDAFKNANAYGGYAFWEHMDNPGAAINNAMNDPAQRVKLEIPADTGGLASHLYVSREYIKQMLFDAVKAAHPDFDLTGSSAQTAADASRRRLEAMRAANMGSGDNFAHPGSVPALPGGAPAGSSAANPSSPVRDETAAEVRRNHPGVAGSGMANDARYDLLGHASHALEDFWSHSNFVEIAIGEPKLNSSQAGLVNTPEAGRGAAGVGADGLTTSTFDSDDSSHSLAHKIRGASDEIQAETALLQHALGRSSTLPSAGDVVLGDERTPTPEGEGEEGHSGWDLFGKGLGAMGEGGWSNFVRNPATIGAGLGGVAGGSMRGWRNWGGGSGWKSWLGTGLGTVGTTAAGALGGLIGGGLSGFVGGAAAGGSSFGSSVEDWTGSSVLGGIAAGVGGIVGGAGGLVSGGISGLVGGIGGGLSSFFSDPGRATTTAEDGVLGSSVFGEENLVKVGASLTVSGSGVALLRGVAEMIEDKTRETQKDKPGSHTMLAKDQPGHDAAHDPSDPDSARDALKTAKFNLAHALSTAADRMIIGEMHKALSAPDAAAAKATLEAVNAKLDQLVGPPGPGHPLWGLVLEHRERAERALQGQYGARPPLGPGDFPAPRGNNVPV